MFFIFHALDVQNFLLLGQKKANFSTIGAKYQKKIQCGVKIQNFSKI
jgi:hypothetical protein